MGTPPPIEIANLGMWDSLILMVMALVVFGPRRLPEIGRQIGKLMYEFRKASNDFKFQMEEELRTAEEADRRKKEEERVRVLALATPAQPTLTLESGNPSTTAESSDPSTDATEPAAAADETLPRIAPPSTGEQVPASRPNSMAALAQAASEAGASVAVEPQPTEAAPDTTISENTDRDPEQAHDPEQAAHHA